MVDTRDEFVWGLVGMLVYIGLVIGLMKLLGKC
jgi:hypothetical protein